MNGTEKYSTWMGNLIVEGWATLIPKNLLESFELIDDNNGSLLLVDCKVFELEVILINVYSPTKDN